MATPNSGYSFTSWTGSVASAGSASTTVTMSAPESVIADFSAVAAPTFTLSSPTGAQTVQPGASAQYTISATAQNGALSNAVTLAASGLPPGATATFSPTSLTPGSSPVTSTLTIQTAAIASVEPAKKSPWPLAAPALALIGLLFLPGKRRRRWISLALLLFASLATFTALTACGGGFGMNAASAPTSYSITVTGTSGSIQQTTTVQLTVQ
jgi:MYXO-CTERM domain-containing protein